MAGWLSRIFRDVELADLPLQFHLDTDARGRHVTRVSYTIGDETRWIEDVGALGAYGGFSIERDGRRYIVSTEDLDTLRAIRSVCSETLPTGEMVSPIYPPVLRYLRQKREVLESESSRESRCSFSSSTSPPRSRTLRPGGGRRSRR